MARMLTDTLSPQTFPILNVLQSHCDKNRYTLVVHKIQKLLRAPTHLRPSQPLDWFADGRQSGFWIGYHIHSTYFDLKRQRSHSRRISMRFKCLRSIWDLCSHAQKQQKNHLNGKNKKLKETPVAFFLTCCVLNSRHPPRSMYLTFEVMNGEVPKENQVSKNLCVFSVLSFLLFLSSHCQSKS